MQKSIKAKLLHFPCYLILIFLRDECLNIITKYKIVEVGKIVETLKMEHRKEWAVGIGNGSIQLILAASIRQGHRVGSQTGLYTQTLSPEKKKGS